jgi:tetratricopeptide (TPR) repeat protein
MGGESTRAGKLLHLCFALLILIAYPGCLSSQKTVTSRGETFGEKKGQPEKSRETAADHLSRARSLVAQGDYEGALREDQKALKLAGKNPPADEALFNLGLIHSSPDNPGKDFGKSLSAFQRVVNEYPGSSRADEAKVWVGILQENERLQTLIQQSKKVDMEVEEKKRERGGK